MEAKLTTLEELKQTVLKSSIAELSYLMGVFGGPHNICLRNKVFTYEAAAALTHLVGREIAKREIDNMLTDELLSE